MSAHDLVDRVLAGQRVPLMSDTLADRIVTEAGRAGRVRSAPPQRRRARHWTRRTVITTAIALNLVVASTVAAAIGGASFVPASIVTATRNVIEQIRPHVPLLGHRATKMPAPGPHRRAQAIAPTRQSGRLPASIHRAPSNVVAGRRFVPPRSVSGAHVKFGRASHRIVRPPHRLKPVHRVRYERRAAAGERSAMLGRHKSAIGPDRQAQRFAGPGWRAPAWREDPRAGWRPGWRRPGRNRFGGPRGYRGRRW